MSPFISEIQQLLSFHFNFSSICAQQVEEIRDAFFEPFIKDNAVNKSNALDGSSNISRQI